VTSKAVAFTRYSSLVTGLSDHPQITNKSPTSHVEPFSLDNTVSLHLTHGRLTHVRSTRSDGPGPVGWRRRGPALRGRRQGPTARQCGQPALQGHHRK